MIRREGFRSALVRRASAFAHTEPSRLAAILLLLFAAIIPAVEAESQSLAQLAAQGQAALRDQHFDRAESIYEQVVKLDPRSALAHSNLGLALYMEEKYPRAITELRKALDLDAHLDHAQVLLALSYFNTGDVDRAVPLLEKSYQVKKDDPVVAAHLGLAYLRQQKDEKALAVAESLGRARTG